jgi:cysteinyl-tRNA synthetase
LEVRNEARKQKQWALSDLIREKLTALGVAIEDTRDGTTWRWG